MNNFRNEIKQLSTHDLQLILNEQQDYYSNEEIDLLRIELKSRLGVSTESASEIEKRIEEENKRKNEWIKREKAKEAAFEARLEKLRKKGYDGYYQYTTISLIDNDGGGLRVEEIAKKLNEYALDGWRLVIGYSNELGHTSRSSGFAGVSSGTNATIDQHILILERFVRI